MLKKLRHTLLSTLIISGTFLSSITTAQACTRVVYLGKITK